MSKVHVDVGSKFGRFSVVGPAVSRRVGKSEQVKLYFPCLCDCGTSKLVESAKLRSGYTVSCGCARRENSAKLLTTHGRSGGHERSRLYRIWLGMKQRCTNPANPAYQDYGDRGISISQEWTSDYAVFYAWAMDNGYSDDLTIERKDNNGNYEPSNCCWIALSRQKRNTRHSVFQTYQGETKCLADWAEDIRCVVRKSALYRRIALGWSFERALTEPVHPN